MENLIPTINYWGIILILLGMQYSAGPANILFATSVGKSGFRNSLPLLIGLWIPAFAYLFLVGFGVQKFQASYSQYFDGLTLLGTLYVFYLGFKFLKQPALKEKAKEKEIAGFKDGLILAILNGKLIAAILTVFAIGLTNDSSLNAVLVIIILFFISGLTANLLWGLGGKIFSSLMGPERIRKQNLTYGYLLLGVAIWMLYMLVENHL